MTESPIVFSGMKPSGDLHLGNLLGALRPWVLEQRLFRNYFCVVDLHALTVPQDPRALAAKSREVAALYIASGIDPATSTLFVQSHLSEHAELAWILGCFTPMGWLERMTQFKDKSRNTKSERIGSGLFNYPVLMAADILLYKTNFVPVGEDQRQHLELTRNVAIRFNRLMGEIFVIPEARIGQMGAGARVMSLQDPASKMSKSEDSEAGVVALLDPIDRVRNKFRRAKTDSGTSVNLEAPSAGVANLLDIYRGLTGCSDETLRSEFEGIGYGQLKDKVADQAIAALEPIQTRYRELTADPATLDAILRHGAEAARDVAEETMRTVRARVGLLPATRL
ncbi:MAG TPA: tryptophan--tRNA ligase [Candidatus Dormibacteraeota bacterium]|nr:tryptophan--tRNA ligase [Candidatus Dormibacteraeota bacterium]